jgi:hypothetical protein
MTLKQKNNLLILTLGVLLFVAYQFAFKKTIALQRDFTELTDKKEKLSQNKLQLGLLVQENRYLDSILNSNNLSADRSFEQNLLSKIDQLRNKHKVKVVSIPEPHLYKDNAGVIHTYSLELTGDFRDLMLFSSELEKLHLAGMKSVAIEKKLNYKTRKEEIICRIILQRISQ